MKIIKPFKFKHLTQKFGRQKIIILDVGCGNHSPQLTKFWLPACVYHGLDKDQFYNNDPADIELMDAFYQVDLVNPDFAEIPNNHFDAIIMSHVIEHLNNGEEVLSDLLPKLKANGILYLEYPSLKSTKLPSMRGTLNFYDDPTHCRLYNQKELYNFLMERKLKIIKGGTRRDWMLILLTPIRALFDLVRYGYVNGSVFWDITGFANYVVAQKYTE